MYESYEECMRALLSDDGIDDAKGGVVSKYEVGFDYNLNNQPEPDDGEPFVGLYPSTTPERMKWTVVCHGRQEAETAHHSFVSNPENGVLYPG
jgi:hypothetical protein